jgi:hypothetical protein
MIYYTQANHSGAALYIFHLLRALTRWMEVSVHLARCGRC